MENPEIVAQVQPPINTQFSIKRVFLVTLVSSLVISAITAIIIFLFGDFGDIETRILITTLVIGGYSLTGLCSAVLYDRKKFLPLAILGMLISFLGFLFTTGVVWELIDFNDIWKPLLIFIILSFSIAHSSLLLLAHSDKKLVNVILAITVSCIAIVAAMLIFLIFEESGDLDEFYYRLLGVFSVLDVLGTIVTPILKKFKS